MRICPFVSNIKETHPGVPTLPPPFVKAFLTLEAVRFLLSVNVSTIIAVPLGPYPSYVIAVKLAALASPAAF